MTAAADWVGSQLDDPDGVLALAAFSSIFKLVGVAAFYPWLDGFSRLIVRISGKGSESAVGRLDPTLAEAGGGVALEAAWRAILEVARGSVDAVRRRLAGESVQYDPPVEAVRQIEHFLESLSLETTDLGTIEPRLVRLSHALDHLTQLHDDLTQIPPAVGGWQPPAGFDAGARALAGGSTPQKTPQRHRSGRLQGARKGIETASLPNAETGRDKMSGRRRPATHSGGDGPRQILTRSCGRMAPSTTHGVSPNR